MVRNPQIELRGLVSFMGDLIKRHKAQKTLFPPAFYIVQIFNVSKSVCTLDLNSLSLK